ncbi:MAG TPA: hypothetical protein VLF20_04025, partial [Patescibacteria group bacterium]|nr:hypothetical protein [Patescibacteria group bacterium]
EVKSREPWWDIKSSFAKASKDEQEKMKKIKYQDIVMPKNTAMGIYLSAFVFIAGFAFVWHIHWLAIVGTIGAIACAFIRAFDNNSEYVLTASEIEKYEKDPNSMPDKYKLWH